MRSLLIATAMCAAALTFTGCSCTVSGPCNSLSHQSRLLGCGCKQGVDCDSCTSCSPRQLIGSWRGQPECCGVNVGDGAPCGLENVSLRRPAKGLLSRLGGNKTNPCGCESGDCSCEQAPATTVIAAPAQSTSDCGCASQTCDGGCGRSRSQLSLGLFGRSSACSQDCDGDCGPNCNNIETVSTQGGLFGRASAMRFAGSRTQGGIATRMQGAGGRGCGRFGCGREGKLCLTCKARSGLGLGANTGCASGNCGRCNSCRSRFERPYAGEIPRTVPTPGMAGQVPQFVYPYYTTRGPRDFLMANPPTIGY